MAGGTKRQRDILEALRALLPRAPLADFAAVADLARAGHLRHLPPSVAAWLAATTHIRHAHTDYDALLDEGYERDAARFFVIDPMNAVLTEWGSPRLVSGEPDEDAAYGSESESSE